MTSASEAQLVKSDLDGRGLSGDADQRTETQSYRAGEKIR